MISKAKEHFNNFKLSIFGNSDLNKKQRCLVFLSFCFLLCSIFFTIIGQLPIFTVTKTTQIFELGWIILLIPLIILDYKQFVLNFLRSLILLIPFLLYLVIAKVLGINSLSNGIVSCIVLSLMIFIIGNVLSKYINKKWIKSALFIYMVSAAIYGLYVLLTKLINADLTNQIYAFQDKNSAGPIFLVGAVASWYIFDKKSVLHWALKIGICVFFLFIIALSKCRTVLFAVPFVVVAIILFEVKNTWLKCGLIAALITIPVVIMAVPYLRENIVVNILLNGKTDIDSISSGRITAIANAFRVFKPILGNGRQYIDCMPVLCLTAFGIVGFITLVPLFIIPYFVFIKQFKKQEDKNLKLFWIFLLIVYTVSAIFEGYGFFGPGAKTFVLWLFVGFEFPIFVNAFKCKPIHSGDEFVKNKVNKIKPSVFAIIACSIIAVFSVLSCGTNLFGGSLGKTIFDKLPAVAKVADYSESTFDGIINPVYLDENGNPIEGANNSLCIGQRITFSPKIIKQGEDSISRLAYGWVNNTSYEISTDKYNEITAVQEGPALLQMFIFRKTNSSYTQFYVVEPSTYMFLNAHISLNEYSKSFDYVDNESLDLDINGSAKVYYDNFYVPFGQDVKYKVVDLDDAGNEIGTSLVAEVTSSGVIIGKNAGKCKVTAVINDLYESRNSITVNVSNTTLVSPTSIEITDIGTDNYQFQPFKPTVEFSSDTTDTNYLLNVYDEDKVLVEDGIYEENDGELRFLNSGTYYISATSLNNGLESELQQVVIQENLPVSFTAGVDRIIIGTTVDANDLDLYIHYANGYKKIVEESDLKIDFSDVKNRAYKDKNGLVNNSRIVIKGVTNGTFKLSLESKYGDAKSSLSFLVTPYTEEEYQSYISLVNNILIVIIFALLSMFLATINYKKVFIYHILNAVAAIIFIGCIAFYSSINAVFYILAGSILAIAIGFSLIEIFLLKGKPLFRYEDFSLVEKEEAPKTEETINP